MQDIIKFQLRKGELAIPLIRILKYVGLADTGGRAQEIVESKLVFLNGNLEMRKRVKIKVGDRIDVLGKQIIIEDLL